MTFATPPSDVEFLQAYWLDASDARLEPRIALHEGTFGFLFSASVVAARGAGKEEPYRVALLDTTSGALWVPQGAVSIGVFAGRASLLT